MNNYVIFGAGELGKKIYKTFSGNINILAFVDNNKSLYGKQIFDDKYVIAPSEIPEGSIVIVGVNESYLNGVVEQLTEMGIDFLFYDCFALEMLHDEFEHVAEYFTDNMSKRTYTEVLHARAVNDFSNIGDLCVIPQYFCLKEFLENKTEGYFIDAGGYLGDTIESYFKHVVGYTKGIISFEPGEETFKKLIGTANRLKGGPSCGDIECVRAALSDEEGTARYMVDGNNLSGSRLMDNGGMLVKTIALDQYMIGRGTVDFIKADVEGSELQLLHGSAEIIKKYRPKLAICLYHDIMDFLEIPKYIKSLVPEYEMRVRHHTCGRYETVLYCNL